MEKIIHISQELYPNLGLNTVAKELFSNINNSNVEKVTIDFTGVKFMSRSFTQEYLFQKLLTDKKIIEINVSLDIQKMFEVVSKDFD